VPRGLNESPERAAQATEVWSGQSCGCPRRGQGKPVRLKANSKVLVLSFVQYCPPPVFVPPLLQRLRSRVLHDSRPNYWGDTI